jgi:hypothetical protein
MEWQNSMTEFKIEYRILRMMSKRFISSVKRRRGSALLIVLGFLSFMMISAVSFAIYMRIERQASSNYRHAAGARHMLNAGLYRAIEDVDLRHNDEVDFSRKFPLFLSGNNERSRVITSLSNNSDDAQQTRVLSLDALAYIPGILANHVRHYAASESNCAEWRQVSMPFANMEGDEAYNEAIVGRYAYACVNVSDMINVNNCRATVRGSGSNQVSIAYLFDDFADAENFEQNRKNTDKYYHTLNDFYACMFEHNDPVFYSPYHEFLDMLGSSASTPFDDQEMENHILVTDGKVKAEPHQPDALNILEFPPVSDISQNNPTIDSTFFPIFKRAIHNYDGNDDYRYAFACMMADYLDDDHVPKSYDHPSMEIAPMICQMSVMASGFQLFERRVVPDIDGDGNDDEAIFLVPGKIPVPLSFKVKVVYPFLQTDTQANLSSDYSVEVEIYLRVHSVSKRRQSLLGGVLPNEQQNYYVRLNGTRNIPAGFDNIRSGGVQADEPYRLIPLELQPTMIGSSEVMIWDEVNGAVPASGFIDGESIMVTLVVGHIGVKDTNGNYVDLVPNITGAKNGNIPPDAMNRFVGTLHKPYFETDETSPLGATFSGDSVPLSLTWVGLETPDPRFNWKVSNWIQSTDAQQEPNQSTLDMLADGNGRDGDIFMSVSNAGMLQSPGELGFFIRPYQHGLMSPASVDFTTQISYDDCTDKDAMFRTIRLYDHDSLEADKIYDYFYAADIDGNMLGTRINPLSDIPNVLKAAIENVPLDYYVAYRNDQDIIAEETDPSLRENNFTEDDYYSGNWSRVVEAWQQKLESVIQNPPSTDKDIKKKFGCNLRDLYFEHNLFEWYHPHPQRDTIFGQSVGVDLHEVDRKMLYSFSLDSFSDSQQLFLYFISAETTAASFGSRARSTASGKAVALVWRNPYPASFERAANGAVSTEPGTVNSFHEHEILYFHYLD